jgi:hypothetical protein
MKGANLQIGFSYAALWCLPSNHYHAQSLFFLISLEFQIVPFFVKEKEKESYVLQNSTRPSS